MVECALDLGIGELLAASHERTREIHVGDARARIEGEVPYEGGGVFIRKKRSLILRKHHGVQGDPSVGEIKREASLPRLLIERACRLNEEGNVGDRVTHAVALALAFDMKRLIEVG